MNELEEFLTLCWLEMPPNAFRNLLRLANTFVGEHGTFQVDEITDRITYTKLINQEDE